MLFIFLFIYFLCYCILLHSVLLYLKFHKKSTQNSYNNDEIIIENDDFNNNKNRRRELAENGLNYLIYMLIYIVLIYSGFFN
jgi:hypothetical protein